MNGKTAMNYLGLFLGAVVLAGICWAADVGGGISVTEIRIPQMDGLEQSKLNQALALFQKNKLALDGLKIYKFEQDSISYSHARCYQLHRGLWVYGEDLIFAFDPGGVFRSLSGHPMKDLPVGVEPRISMQDAAKVVYDSNWKDSVGQIVFQSNRCFAERLIYQGKLAWRISLKETAPSFAVVDALTSEIICRDDGIRFQGGGPEGDPGEMQ